MGGATVRSTDITYTAVAGRRAFVIGIVDWFSRKVLAYNVVNTMDAFHCVETLKTAMDFYGKPEIFNSDQGSQFTSSEFIAELRTHGIQISMDGRGRCLDNAKMERFWWCRDFFVFKGQVSKLRFSEKWLSSSTVKQENEFMMIFKELQRRTKSFSKKRKRRRRDVFGGF